ncbi:MAG: patatin-like phospholipase family protein [Clostridia bacterium]|nr:patatin-like phospholipase family protein [Clostridia bacterium]
MKRAIVYSGGGSRGAYECGAWQAIDELGIRLDGAYGTSIGAINAALTAQGDLDQAVRLWDTITLKQVLGAVDEEDFSVDHMISRKRDIVPFLLENAKNFRMDVGPLMELLHNNIDEGKIRASGKALGMMLTRVPSLTGRDVRLADIPQGRLAEYVLASASCFPVFPMCVIDDERYIDGGYSDNMPIGMALADGAEEIIAVDIHPQPTHPEFTRMPFLKLIHPLHELGNFLDFNPARLRRSRMMGYYDAMKAYDRFDGIRYTFARVNDLQIADAARRYAARIGAFEAGAVRRNGDAALISALGSETPLRMLSWKEMLLRGLELCAQIMCFREDAIYDMDQLTDRILTFVRSGDEVDTSDRGFAEAMRADGRTQMRYLYRALRADDAFAAGNERKLSEMSGAAAAAMYLLAVEG